MKKILLLSAMILIGLANACAQGGSFESKNSRKSEVLVPRYKLFPTQNNWIFLKLDTSQGFVTMVQYSLEDEKRLEVPIRYQALASGVDAIPGRFNLYPTQNMWNFILLDEWDGRTWQVQWSINGNEAIVPINDIPSTI